MLSEIETFNVDSGKIVLWFLGGCGFVLKTPEQTIYIDPYFGGSLAQYGNILRMISVPIEPSLIKKADIVLCTHEHPDHCDKESLLPIYRNTNAYFIATEEAVKKGFNKGGGLLKWGFNKERIREVKPGDEIKIKDLNVHATESYDPRWPPAVTYILQSQGVTIFHSGDSQYFNGYLKIGEKWKIDISLINFGKNPPGEQIYNTPCDFFRTARDLHTQIAIPMHWDIWKYTYQDPIILHDLFKYWNPKFEVLIMRLGDKLVYPE